MVTKDLSRRVPKILRGYGMNEKFGPLLSRFAARYLDDIPYPEEMAARIRDLSTRGDIVYVHRTQNIAEHIALQSAIQRYNLPKARFTGGMNVAAVQPWWRFPRRTPSGTTAERELELLRICIESGCAAELYLRRPLTLINVQTASKAKYVEALIELSRQRDRPIFLVPHFLALRSEPGKFDPTAADAIFGTADAPGTIRALARVMLSRGVARFEVSEPIDLKSFIQDQGSTLRNSALAKKVRWSILHHLARIEKLAHGPPLKSPSRMMDDVFKDSLLQGAIQQEATTSGKALESVRREAMSMYKEVAAKPDFDWARVLDKFLRLIWFRIYDGLHIEQTDIEKIRKAARSGPIVLVPSHRSHVDYLVMSQAFLWNGLLPPFVAAGENLNFFPLGAILRRGGGYFIRRTFAGSKLYPQVVRAYVRRLYREGFTQEFFIEGGRSRTGKTLPPKMGMLRIMIDAYLESKQPDAIFVPAHIAYEKIIEGGAYARELKGEEKEKESAGALLRSASLLTSRYGRVFITFHDAISLKSFVENHGHTKESLLGAPEQVRRHLVQTLAHRIVYGINSAVVITPMSLLCLIAFGFRGRGIAEQELADAILVAIGHLRTRSAGSARFSPGLLDEPLASVKTAIELLRDEGSMKVEVIANTTYYRPESDAYPQLEFYKNSILHFFAPECILATAVRSISNEPGTSLKRDELREAALQLSRIFKFEFTFQEGSFDDLFDATIDRAANHGVLTVDENSVTLTTEERALRWGTFTGNLIANFVDSYWSTFHHIVEVIGNNAVPLKQVITKSLEHARADFMSGRTTCEDSISKANITACIDLLLDQHVLVREEKLLRYNEDAEPTRQQLEALLSRARMGKTNPAIS